MASVLEAIQQPEPPAKPVGSTLLELVMQLNEITDSEQETVEQALEALDSGRVELTGNFRGCRLH